MLNRFKKYKAVLILLDTLYMCTFVSVVLKLKKRELPNLSLCISVCKSSHGFCKKTIEDVGRIEPYILYTIVLLLLFSYICTLPAPSLWLKKAGVEIYTKINLL